MENTELIEKILDLKGRRAAVILAHNYEVKVPEEIRLKAKLAVDRMLKIGRAD